jgi:dolichyl-phosphate-mannose-protein mannosyltransferase
VRKSPPVFDSSTAWSVAVVAIVFVAAHLALLVGVTTPEKFYFDEVHYVPAARQMLEPVIPSPMLNPMHPPLAKQLMAVSIRVFGDAPLGWRYPSVLFGSLAIVAIYLCGLALFTAQGPAVASALIAFFNQMVSCSRGSRCWIFPHSRSPCWRSQRSSPAFGNGGRTSGSLSQG